MALTAVLTNIARTSGENLSADGIGKFGIEPQLVDMVLIVVEFMFSGLTRLFFVSRSAPLNEKLFVWKVFTANLLVFRIYLIYDYFIH